MRNFSPVSEIYKKRPNIPGTSSGAKFEKQSKHGETKKLYFRAYHSFGMKAVSLQLNGMLMMWKIQQAMQDDAIWTARIHPAFFPVTGLKCSYGKISSPLTEISGTEPARPLMNTSKIKRFRGNARSRKPGEPGQSDSCEDVLNSEVGKRYPASRGFSLAWLLALTKSFASLSHIPYCYNR